MPLLFYYLKLITRAKTFVSGLFILAISCSLCVFFAGSGPTEQDQFLLIFLASAIRIIAVIFSIILTCFFVQKIYDRQELSHLLSKGVSKFNMLLSLYGAFFIYALFFVVLYLGLFVFSGLHNSSILWLAGSMIELFFMIQIALFFSLILSNFMVSVSASMGLYILGRLMGNLILISQSGKSQFGDILNIALQGISFFIPRFDLMIQSQWLLYQTPLSMMHYYPIIQCGILSIFCFIACLYDLKRKEF